MDSLKPDKRNARKHNPRNVGMISDSIQRDGFGRSILLAADGTILAGNATYDAASAAGMDNVIVVESDGHSVIAVKRTDVEPGSPEALRLALSDNRAAELAEWDTGVLAMLGEEIDMAAFFRDDELAALVGRTTSESEDSAREEQGRQTLAERFGVPPFTVLDARQGYWQERKRGWLSLGIQSELGRGGNALGFSEGEHVVGENLTWVKGNGTDETSRKNLAGGRKSGVAIHDHEWQRNKLGNVQAPEQASGTSVFDPVLCELAYRWFSPPGGVVLDPFAGGSVRGIVAHRLGRQYVGVDLSEPQITANVAQAATITPDNAPVWIVGDSSDVAELTAPHLSGPVDFVFSCPPYADLEVYSDDTRDLSTMPYEEFIAAYRRIIAASVDLLAHDRFACFVVGDVRDKKGNYRNFVSHTIQAFEDAGAHLYNEAILVTALGSLPIRAGRQFEAGRKLGKTHQNVLVFAKGDGKLATEAIGAVECGAWD